MTMACLLQKTKQIFWFLWPGYRLCLGCSRYTEVTMIWQWCLLEWQQPPLYTGQIRDIVGDEYWIWFM
jgi:hypothetical protein